MSIMDKLKKNSKIKQTEVLSDSKFFNDKEMTPTDVLWSTWRCLGRLTVASRQDCLYLLVLLSTSRRLLLC